MTSAEPPGQLTDYIRSLLSEEGQRVRCRCILHPARDGEWEMVSCVVEVFPNKARTPAPVPPRHYNNSLLHEEWFDLTACETFVAAIQAGNLAFGESAISRKELTPYWRWERVPLKNYYMRAAGLVVRTTFHQNMHCGREGLISPTEPYYPDELEAAHNWLAEGADHRYVDGRNGEIAFLLPENRAFFADMISNDTTLEFEIGGNLRESSDLMITGAYWKDGLIHHFTADIAGGIAEAAVPDDVSRLECALLDGSGTVFDRYFEIGGRRAGPFRRRLSEESDLSAVVMSAIGRGEGEKIEFKPLVDPSEGPGGKGRKTKYGEVVRTAVAFANLGGGSIFLGIDDNCIIIGVDTEFGRIERSAVTEGSVHAYCGKLRNTIKNDVEGEIELSAVPVLLQGRWLVIIDVQEAAHKNLMVRGDESYYRRVGASNRKIPVKDLILPPSASVPFFQPE